MNERTKQFRVGLVVFSTMIISSTLVVLNSDFSSTLPFSTSTPILWFNKDAFAKAGLKLKRVVPTRGPVSVLEAVPG